MNTADRGGVCDLVLVSRTRSAEEKFCSAGPADASIEGRTDSAVPLSCPEIRGFRAAVLRVRIHLPPAASLRTNPLICSWSDSPLGDGFDVPDSAPE